MGNTASYSSIPQSETIQSEIIPQSEIIETPPDKKTDLELIRENTFEHIDKGVSYSAETCVLKIRAKRSPREVKGGVIGKCVSKKIQS